MKLFRIYKAGINTTYEPSWRSKVMEEVILMQEEDSALFSVSSP